MLDSSKRRSHAPRASDASRNGANTARPLAAAVSSARTRWVARSSTSDQLGSAHVTHSEATAQPTVGFFRQHSANAMCTEAGPIASPSAPPSRDLWGVMPTLPHLPMPLSTTSAMVGAPPPLYDESTENQELSGVIPGARPPYSARRRGELVNSAPVLERSGGAAMQGRAVNVPQPPLYRSAAHLSQSLAVPHPLGLPPPGELSQSLQWCESPSLTALQRPLPHQLSGLPSLGNVPMETGVAVMGQRSTLSSPVEVLPPPHLPTEMGAVVPSSGLQAIINDFLAQRFWSMGASDQASRFMEPERQLLQDLMCYHFFKEEAQRQARLRDCPPVQPPKARLSTHEDLASTAAATSYSAALTSEPSHELEPQLRRRYRHQRFGHNVQWDLIFPFWAGSPPLTVEATSPTARRRVEQWRWQALVLDTALSYTPAVMEEPAGSDMADYTAFVADPLARLNGRARECPPLPMTRRTAWDPHRTATPPLAEPAATARAILQRKQDEARALDGTSFMACIRQSLLIDQGVRLHRVLRAEGAEWRPLLYPLPFLKCGASDDDSHDRLRAALLTEDTGSVLARTHVDALSSKGRLAALRTGTGQNSPRQACLVTDPAAASVHGEAQLLSPLSYPLGFGHGPETNGNLSASLTALFSGLVTVPAAAFRNDAVEAGGGGGSHSGADANGHDCRHTHPSTAYLSWAQWASALRHPLLAGPFRSLVVEDVTGTCHIFCGSPSPAPSSATLSWSRHRHAPRQAPVLASRYPLARKLTNKQPQPEAKKPSTSETTAVGEDGVMHSLSDADDEADRDEDDDYVLCPVPRTPSHEQLPRTDANTHNATHVKPQADDVSDGRSTWCDDGEDADESIATHGTLATTRSSAASETYTNRQGNVTDMNAADEYDGISEDEEGACATASAVEKYRFGLMMEEWNAKRAGVVRRMDMADPPWRMIGVHHGAEPRPLALHLTESQLPWLAAQLCPDHDGLLDLQELHVAFAYETMFRRESMHAWLWIKAVLMTRQNLLAIRLHFAHEPGAVGTGVDSDDDEMGAPSGGDGAMGPSGSVLVGGIALPARTVARVSARVSARSLSSAIGVATGGAGGLRSGAAGFDEHTSQPPPPLVPSTGTSTARATMAHSAPSPSLALKDDDVGSISRLVSPALGPQPHTGQGEATAVDWTNARRPPPPDSTSLPPRPLLIHQPQPRSVAATTADHDESNSSASPELAVSHINHQDCRSAGTSTAATTGNSSGGNNNISSRANAAPPATQSPPPVTAVDASNRPPQRAVVGVCSTVPQPEDDPAVLREVMLRGVEFTPSLQVLHVQNGPMEVLRTLLRETRQQHHHYYYGNMAQSPYASLIPPAPKPGVNPELVSPLHEIYFSAEQHPRARREAVVLEVTVHRFPLLEVLWIDAPRIHHVFFTPLTSATPLNVPAVPKMPLRELHLLLDASFSSSSLAGIETVSTLEVIHLERVVVNTLSFLGESPSLRELLLHACRFVPCTTNEDGVLQHPLLGVERAPALETLSLAYTNDAKTVDNFARCPALRKLILTRCNGISTASLVGLEKLPRLTELSLEYTRVTNLSVFASTPSLRVLRLCGCKRVLRTSILDLERSPNLSELYLNDTNVVTVANLGCGSSFIRVLDLSGCRHLDDSGMQGLQGLSHLEILTLSHTPVVRVEFLRDCPVLATLYLERCPRLAPDGLCGLEGLPRLQRLVVTGCTALETVGTLGASKSLVALSLGGCSALSSHGLAGIERCVSLRYLHLADTALSSVGFLASGARRLQYLNLSGCVQLSTQGLHGLEKLPALVDLYLERLSNKVNDLRFLMGSRSLRRISLRDSTGVSVYARRDLARSMGITIEH